MIGIKVLLAFVALQVCSIVAAPAPPVNGTVNGTICFDACHPQFNACMANATDASGAFGCTEGLTLCFAYCELHPQDFPPFPSANSTNATSSGGYNKRTDADQGCSQSCEDQLWTCGIGRNDILGCWSQAAQCLSGCNQKRRRQLHANSALTPTPASLHFHRDTEQGCQDCMQNCGNWHGYCAGNATSTNNNCDSLHGHCIAQCEKYQCDPSHGNNQTTNYGGGHLPKRATADLCQDRYYKCIGTNPSQFDLNVCSGCQQICIKDGPNAPSVCESALTSGTPEPK